MRKLHTPCRSGQKRRWTDPHRVQLRLRGRGMIRKQPHRRKLNMHAVPKVFTLDPLFISVVKSEVKIPVICKMMAINDDPTLAGKKAEAAG